MSKDNHPFSKEEIKDLVESCQTTITSFITSDATINVRYNHMEQIVHTIMSVECTFGYLYAEVNKYGKITEVISPDSDVYARYTLAASLVFSEPTAMKKFIGKLPSVWDTVVNFAEQVGLSCHPTPSLDLAMDRITRAIHIIYNQYESG